MSDGIHASGAGQPHTSTSAGSSMVDIAKDEAADLKDTTADVAKDVAHTVKDETSSVAHETKAQAQELFRQARRELSDQAATQQERIAAGLGVLGDELASMARNSEGSGMAADLVQRASTRASSAASWLAGRDPSGVLDEVKGFARNRPTVFIGAALLTGVIAGRLTRALMAHAKEESERPVDQAPADSTPTVPLTEDAPLYAESAARFDSNGLGASREQSDTL